MNLLYALSSEFLNYWKNYKYIKTSALLKLSQENKEKIEKAKLVLNAELGAYESVKGLAKKVEINVITLQKGFKELYGTTVNQYVQNLRLERAAYMLINTNLHVSEIVYNLGLTNKSYFTKSFKESKGVTPTAFRNKYQIL